MEKRGFTYNENTFDDLFVHGWGLGQNKANQSTESSDEDDEAGASGPLLGKPTGVNTFGEELSSVVGPSKYADIEEEKKIDSDEEEENRRAIEEA